MKKNVTFREWSVIAKVAGFKIEGRAAYRPQHVGKHATPQNFEDVTLGQIIELSRLGDTPDVVHRLCHVMMGITADEVNKAKAVDVVLFALWVTEQVEKVNTLFAKLRPTLTAEELQAGADKLNFGLFGMVDAYARRMGITDHEQVLRTPWMVVYKCLEIDYQTNQYERRLNKIAADKMQRRKK